MRREDSVHLFSFSRTRQGQDGKSFQDQPDRLAPILLMWIPWGPPLSRNSSVSPAHPWPSLPGSLGFSQAQRTNMHSLMIKAPAAALLGKGVGAAREELGT